MGNFHQLTKRDVHKSADSLVNIITILSRHLFFIPLVLYRMLQFRVSTSKHCHEAKLGLMEKEREKA
jgi:hypothetical protein